MGDLVAAGRLSICSSTVMKEELLAIPEIHRPPHIQAYSALKVIAGHPTTEWVDDNPESPSFGNQTVHPDFEIIAKTVPDKNDARHLFQAKMNGVIHYVTVDERTILRRADEIRCVSGLNAWSPWAFVDAIEKDGLETTAP